MPPARDDPEALPFPAGTSPFRLKGVVYQGHADYANEFIPGGERAVADSFRDEGLRAFFHQRFLASSWYDALPIVPVWLACARLLGQEANDFLRERTRHQAQRDIHGVYRFLLKLTSAESIAVRMPRVLQQYFDFGRTEASVVAPALVRARVTGVPMGLVPWFRIVSETFLQVALELSGARFVQIRRLAVDRDGTAHGVPLGALGFEIRTAPAV